MSNDKTKPAIAEDIRPEDDPVEVSHKLVGRTRTQLLKELFGYFDLPSKSETTERIFRYQEQNVTNQQLLHPKERFVEFRLAFIFSHEQAGSHVDVHEDLRIDLNPRLVKRVHNSLGRWRAGFNYPHLVDIRMFLICLVKALAYQYGLPAWGGFH